MAFTRTQLTPRHTRSYRTVDRPRYILGHAVVIGFLCMGLIAAPIYAWLLKRENARRDRWQEEQNALPDEKKTVFTVEELRDQGDRAMEFRYTSALIG